MFYFMDIFIFFYLFIFLFIFSFKNCICQDDDSFISYCFHNDYGVYSLLNEYCFNKILIFKNKDFSLIISQKIKMAIYWLNLRNMQIMMNYHLLECFTD